jgi:hypothetical protein
MRIRLKTIKMKIKRMSHLKNRTMIKGEMKLIKTRKMIKKYRSKTATHKSPPSDSKRPSRELHPRRYS